MALQQEVSQQRDDGDFLDEDNADNQLSRREAPDALDASPEERGRLREFIHR